MARFDDFDVRGVDCSSYQKEIQWDEVALSGISFAFARVSDGLSLDSKFQQNWAGIKDVGLVRGVYQFYRSTKDPVEQADLLLDQTGPLDLNDLPPVLDVEADNGASPEEMVAGITAWKNRIIERTGGLSPIIYAGPGFWGSHVKSSAFGDLPLWVAHYTTGEPLLPEGWSDWAFWQYSGSGLCPGIDAKVDLNVFAGSLSDLQAFTVGQQGDTSGGPGSPGWSPAARLALGLGAAGLLTAGAVLLAKRYLAWPEPAALAPARA